MQLPPAVLLSIMVIRSQWGSLEALRTVLKPVMAAVAATDAATDASVACLFAAAEVSAGCCTNGKRLLHRRVQQNSKWLLPVIR